MTDERRILKEYVKSVLLEDDGGYGMTAADISDSSPYGISMGGPSLYKIFVEPFVDVFKTGKAAAEDMSTRSRAAAKVAFEAIASSLIPIYSTDYQKIFEKEHQQLAKIKEKYRDVFERTDKALFNEGNDFVVMAFLMDPARYITFTALKSAPQAVLGVLEVLAGENAKLRRFFDKLKLNSHNSSPARGSSNHMGGQGYLESKLYEEGEPPDPLATKLNNPKVMAALSASPKVQAMKRDAQVLANASVSELLEKVKALNSARTIEDLARSAPGFDRSKLAAIQKLPPNEKQAVESAIVNQVKKAAQQFYLKTMQSQIDSAMKAGVPSDNRLLQGYKKVMGMIRSS